MVLELAFSSKLASTPLGSKNFPGLKGAGFNLKLGSLRTVADSERALATAGVGLSHPF